MGFAPNAAKVSASKPTELVFFETEPPPAPPAVEDAPPPVVPPPPPVARAPKAAAPKLAAPEPPAAPAPAEQPPLVAPTEVAEQAPAPQPAPAVGVPLEATSGQGDKGMSVGSPSVGAKSGTGTGASAPGAVSLRGVVGGTGDRSRAAGLAESRRWDDCAFPREADDEGIEDARVELQVVIGPDSQVQKVVVVRDPGFGFAQEARRCVMRRRWLSRLDAQGAPAIGTANVTINFER